MEPCESLFSQFDALQLVAPHVEVMSLPAFEVSTAEFSTQDGFAAANTQDVSAAAPAASNLDLPVLAPPNSLMCIHARDTIHVHSPTFRCRPPLLSLTVRVQRLRVRGNRLLVPWIRLRGHHHQLPQLRIRRRRCLLI